MVLAEALDERADLDHLLGVEADGRLVEDEHRRVADECLRKADTLLIALGQVLDEAVFHILHLAERHDVLQMGAPGQLAFFQVKDKVQIALDRHIGIQRRNLREIADIGLCPDRVLKDVGAVDEHLPRGRGDVAGEHVHGRGLAGAVRAKKAQNLAVLNSKADVVHSLLVTVVLCQISDFDHEVEFPPYYFFRVQATPHRAGGFAQCCLSSPVIQYSPLMCQTGDSF